MALLPPPSVIMPMVTVDWVAASGFSVDAAAAPAEPTPAPTTVADRVAVVMAATPSRLRPAALAFALPRRRSPDRLIAPAVSTVPPWGSGGGNCAHEAAPSPPEVATKEDTVYRLRWSTYCNIRGNCGQERFTFLTRRDVDEGSSAAPLLRRSASERRAGTPG